MSDARTFAQPLTFCLLPQCRRALLFETPLKVSQLCAGKLVQSLALEAALGVSSSNIQPVTGI